MIKNMMVRIFAGLVAVSLLGVVSFAQTQHIFYRGTDGNINHIWYDGTIHRDQWTVAAKAPLTAGDPATKAMGH